MNTNIDLGKLALVIRKSWWIIIGLALLLFTAVRLYLRYTVPVYQAETQLKIDVSDATQNPAELVVGGQSGINAERTLAELEVLQSREMLGQVVRALNLQVAYFRQGRIIETEVLEAPFKLAYDSTTFRSYGNPIRIVLEDSLHYQYGWADSDNKLTRATFGQTVRLDSNLFVVTAVENAITLVEPNKEYRVIVYGYYNRIDKLRKNLLIAPYKGYSLFQLQYSDVVPQRAALVLNTLTNTYLAKELALRRRSFDQTLTFINDLIVQINQDLQSTQTDLEKYERTNRVPATEVLRNVQSTTYGEYTSSIGKLQSDLIVLRNLRQYVAQKLTDESLLKRTEIFIPAITSESLAPLADVIGSLNDLLLQRYTFLERNTMKSPVIIQNTASIQLVRNQLMATLDRTEATINQEIATKRTKLSSLDAELNSYPSAERDFRFAARPYTINEKTYEELLASQRQVQLSRAAIVSNSAVVNPALPPLEPISPKAMLLTVGSLVVGLLVGTFAVVSKELFRRTLANRKEVEQLTDAPLVAEIVRSKARMRNFELEVLTEPKSAITESFRGLRANLAFLTNDAQHPHRTIAITSTVSGEGKSYISTNLCATLTLLKKRVILVDLDLRKPKLHTSLNVPNDIGASSILSGQVPLNRAIQNTSYQHFDILTAGPTPPNPAELLSSQAFQDMLAELERAYDYVVVDTSPVGLVTDSMPILKSADIVLYILRSNFSQKIFLNNLTRLRNDQGLDNLFLVLNYVDQEDQSYGYGYGYGYGTGYYVDSTKKDTSLMGRVRNLLG